MEEKQHYSSKKKRKRRRTVETEEDEELHLRTVRKSAEKCFRFNQHMVKVQQIVKRTHRITTLASILFNFYIRELLKDKEELPTINTNFLLQFFYSVAKGRGKPYIHPKIEKVKEKYMPEIVEMREGIPTNVLLENAALLATNFKTNIEMHLYQRLYKGVKALEGENTQSVFQSILNNKIDHELSLGKNPTFAEKVRLTAKIQEILKDEKKKLFSVIPLVRNNVPHCITLDTVSFFDIFKDECGLLGWKRGNIVQNREEL
jgi:hypothetical protein